MSTLANAAFGLLSRLILQDGLSEAEKKLRNLFGKATSQTKTSFCKDSETNRKRILMACLMNTNGQSTSVEYNGILKYYLLNNSRENTFDSVNDQKYNYNEQRRNFKIPKNNKRGLCRVQ